MSKQKQNSELNAKLNKIESHEIPILAKNDGNIFNNAAFLKQKRSTKSSTKM